MPAFSLKPLFIALMVAGLGLPHPVHAGTVDADQKAAVIFAYFAIGDDSNPNASLRAEQFTEQMDELAQGGYEIKKLPDVIAAFRSGKTLPDRTIAITFDGADKSILDGAVPYLVEHDLPFTVFVPASRVDADKPPYMNWEDLRALKKTGLATFGLHPADYSRLADAGEESIRRQINNSIALLRDNLGVETKLIAYPFGEYSETFKQAVKSMGFDAAFGQQSGVADGTGDLFTLPRFTQTERYGDLERFRMTASALPLPVKDISPANPHLDTLTPAIGFTVADELVGDLKNLSCFSSTDDKPEVQIVGKRRVEIRLKAPLAEDRPRINCTLPVATNGADEPRWRWLGMLYTVDAKLLEDAALEGTDSGQNQAQGNTDYSAAE